AANVGQEARPAQQSADEQGAGGDHLGRGLADQAPAQPGDDRGQQRQENDEDYRVHQPRIRLTSSTAIEPRRRKKMTRMARPMAASAAATVSTNIANTWPTTSPRWAEKAERFILPAARC